MGSDSVKRERVCCSCSSEKDLLPRTLKFFSALGDLDAVRVHLERRDNPTAVNEAFIVACSF